MYRWWKRIQLDEKLSFAWARLIECFYWSVGYNFGPEFGYARRVLTAINAFITTIDDIYDFEWDGESTLKELELLTKLTKRWDTTELDQLPDYTKICFTDFYNEINEWTYLFDAFLEEGMWYHSGYKPSLAEYLDKAWLSISGHVLLTHLYFVHQNSMNDQDFKSLMTYSKILRLLATILRLADDMETSSYEMERGDNPKSIKCYMNDNGVSEEEAKEHIKISFSVYLYGDGHGAPSSYDKERLLFLFVNPIPL
ncbi:hypothetical protein POM88_030070 [Heracleum sosnowskyi]|uniref:Terpene synthase n=1 Tax=Heracleum sosnowskyi TaxID=360622 RepID=A0AAD8MIB2_9APIA|nr:hypothetical protein POM88_030070 [Heracleum sosnowskyi]